MRFTIASAVPLVIAITIRSGFAAAADDHVIVYPSSDTIWYMTEQTHHVVWNPSKLPGTAVNATLELTHPDLAAPIPLRTQGNITLGRYSVNMPGVALKLDDAYQVAMIVEYLMTSSEISTSSVTTEQNTGTMTTATDQNTMTTPTDTTTGTSTATMEKRSAWPRGIGRWARLMHLKRKADQTPPYHPGRDTTTDTTSSSSGTDSTTTATTTTATTTTATTTPTTTSGTSTSTSPTSTGTETSSSTDTNTNTSDTCTSATCTTTGAPSTISASPVTSTSFATTTKFFSPKFTFRASP